MSNMLRTVVVPTDFSENAMLALDWAIAVAKPHGAQITLVHAQEPPFAAVDLLEGSINESIKQQLANSESKVRSASLQVTVEHDRGRPWHVINEVAQAQNADLIVIGTRGRTGYKRVLLGSTTDRLIRTSRVPVLVVHPHDSIPATGLKTILVPVDFSEESSLATSMAVRLLQSSPEGGRIVLLHAIELKVEWPTPDAPTVHPQYWDNAEADAKRNLEAIAAPMRNNRLAVDVRTFRGYAPDAIEQEAKASRAELIAMGTHGRGGIDRFLIGSVAERVLHNAACPVLTVRRPTTDQPIRVSAES